MKPPWSQGVFGAVFPRQPRWFAAAAPALAGEEPPRRTTVRALRRRSGTLRSHRSIGLASPSGCTRLSGFRPRSFPFGRPTHLDSPHRPFVRPSSGDIKMSHADPPSCGLCATVPSGEAPYCVSKMSLSCNCHDDVTSSLDAGAFQRSPFFSIAQHTTNSRRASATTACLRRVLPPFDSRRYVDCAHPL